MKKILAITMSALMLTAVLCGCGMTSDANSTVYDGTGTDDGFVNDRDGYIEDHDSTAYPVPTPGTGTTNGGSTASGYQNGTTDSGSTGTDSNSSSSGTNGTPSTQTPQPSPQTTPQAK